MSLVRGDVVLVPFPLPDGSASKVRPALVVQCDRNNARLNAVIVALITSNIDRASRESTQCLVDVSTADGLQSGLLHTSAIKCEHLSTIDRRLVLRAVGRLSQPLMAIVDRCLKASLDLA